MQDYNFSFFIYQGELVDVIAHSVQQTADFVYRGRQETRRAVTYYRRAERVSVFVFLCLLFWSGNAEEQNNIHHPSKFSNFSRHPVKDANHPLMNLVTITDTTFVQAVYLAMFSLPFFSLPLAARGTETYCQTSGRTRMG